MVPRPPAYVAHPGPASELRAFPSEAREDIACEGRQGQARHAFDVSVILQPEDAQLFSAVALDFSYAEPRIDRGFVQ